MTPRAAKFKAFLETMWLGVLDFSRHGYHHSPTKASKLEDANCVTSVRDGSSLGNLRHNLLLDIDHEAYLVKSSTPGHYHLYVDIPGGIAHDKWADAMSALANAGVIESGYAAASIDQGHATLRVPWDKKKAGE